MIAEIIGGIIVMFFALLVIATILAFALPGLILFFYDGPPLRSQYVSKHPYDYDEDR